MNSLELKVGPFGTADILSSQVIDLFIEFIENLLWNDCLKAIDHSILVFFRPLLFGVTLKHFDSFIDVEAKRHVD